MNKTIHQLDTLTPIESTDEMIVYDVSAGKSKKVQVKDVAGNYSETETLTGKTWIDGKPIYRKVYYSATNWTQYQIIDTIAISKLVNIISKSTDNNGNIIVGSCSIGDNTAYISGQNLRALRSSGFVNTNPSTIIIEYTKS